MYHICIIGHGGHGKDTMAEILKRKFGFKFQSSSEKANELFIFETLKDKYGYQTLAECFNDRASKREEWHNLIVDYNKNNPSALAEEILKENEIYVGMRSDRELSTCLEKKLFKWVIGVYDPRKPEEPRNSFDIDFWEKSDFVISNSSTLEDFESKIVKLFIGLLKW